MLGPDAGAGFLTLGQTTAKTIAMRTAGSAQGRHALLVHGPRGADKRSFVDDLLALALCESPIRGGPCNACRGCRTARTRSHPDLVIATPETWREGRGAGESIVAVARRWLLDAAGAPIVAALRMVVIEGADRASEQIQNALLKALEEPGPRQRFILVADDASRLLPTIRSRCQPLRIGPVPRVELAAWLMDGIGLPADQADAIARISGGLAGRAADLARNAERVAWQRRAQGELLRLVASGRAERFSVARDLIDDAVRSGVTTTPVEEPGPEGNPGAAAQRAAALAVLDVWTALGRDLLIAASGRPDLAPAGELLADLDSAAADIDRASLVVFLSRADRVRDGLEANGAPRLALEAAMLAWPSR